VKIQPQWVVTPGKQTTIGYDKMFDSHEEMELNGLNQVRNNDVNFLTDNLNRPMVPQE
jgi:hypothetical protein